jgi:hypothetical protein
MIFLAAVVPEKVKKVSLIVASIAPEAGMASLDGEGLWSSPGVQHR